MTATGTDQEALCACGCGETLPAGNKSGYKRGHKLRDAMGRLTALPDADEDLDAGEADPDQPDGSPDLDVPEWLLRGEQPPGREPDGGELPPDAEPAHLTARPGRGGKPAAGKSRTRVTATVRKDVHAKIRFILVPGTRVWSARDPVCGLIAIEQEPEISAALAEIVCDSPDLLAWFTGPAGGFMKYFRLVMALQPVAVTVWLHHVAHVPVVPADAQQPPQPNPAWAA